MAIMREETKPSTKLEKDNYPRDDEPSTAKKWPRDTSVPKDRGVMDTVNYGNGARAI